MPCLLYNGQSLVKTIKFKSPDYIGDPINAVKIYNEKEVDELILLDIFASRQKRDPDFEQIKEVASECFMPFAYGGGVNKIEHFKQLFSIGVEKVVVNSLIFTNPAIIEEASKLFGAQSIIGSIDLKKNFFGKYRVFSHSGYKTKLNLLDFSCYVENMGVGELFINSVDKDGTWEGFEYEEIQKIANSVSLPIIACGGAGGITDLRKVLYEFDINAAALGSMAVYQKKGMGVLIGFPKREKIIEDEYSITAL